MTTPDAASRTAVDVLHRLGDLLGQSWSLWLGALRLDPDIATVLDPHTSWIPVIVIAVAAGAATLVGQIVVLLVTESAGGHWC